MRIKELEADLASHKRILKEELGGNERLEAQLKEAEAELEE